MHNWIKKGQIFSVQNSNQYLVSHASNPLACHIRDDIFRVFYSGRNIDNKSSVGYVDIDILTHEIIKSKTEPVLTYGKEDTFSSHGISIGNAYNVDEKTFILFMAWQVPSVGHWRGDIGRLELIDNEKLVFADNKPFMGIDEVDKISLSYPYVVFHEGIYKMWYGSTISWDAGNKEMIHVIKYATSLEGNTWEKHGIAIPYKLGVAQAFSRPTVIIDETGYRMWYSYRKGNGDKYKIGYATSNDGYHWVRVDEYSGIEVSDDGWDSEMICYPFVFKHKDKLYMLYNGNDYGKEGFGLCHYNDILD